MYRVYPSKVNENSPIVLPQYYDSKSFTIGRKDCNFNAGNREVGREQAKFTFDPITGVLKIENGSVNNPCYIRRKSTNKIKRVLDEPVNIYNGDDVSLLGDVLWIKIEIISSESQTLGEEDFSILGKRKRDEKVPKKEEEEDPSNIPMKKRKITNFPDYNHPGVRFGVKKRTDWKSAFIDILSNENTDINRQRIYFRDEKIVTIYDAFPKGKKHLVMIVRSNVNSVLNLRRSHLKLLKHMKTLSLNISDHLISTSRTKKFLIGFHSIPSLFRLHLHIVSNDLNGECLKNKKHYNSFTTPFFLGIDNVISMIEKKGRVLLNEKEMKDFLEISLKCHCCGKFFRNIPTIKQHLDFCSRRK